MNEWISVKDRMPVERDSIFAKLYGTGKWSPVMFKKYSEPVIACVKMKNGKKIVSELCTHDGEWWMLHASWWNSGYYGKCKVTHWMPLPEPPKEEPAN